MAPSIELQDFDAVLFDLDGVLTTTRAVHAMAWKHSFDEFLAAWDAERGTRTARFDESVDYANYVDGSRARMACATSSLLAESRCRRANRIPRPGRNRCGVYGLP
jgi:beta-phosphoglucomutase-like phosphatase (HAD superfamily)